MQKQLRHIFSLLLALQVVVASTGATFYKHYCAEKGELIAVSAYAAANGSCCSIHDDHGKEHCQVPEHEQDEGCCNLQYEFRKADSAPLAESLKSGVPLVISLPEHPSCALLPIFQISYAINAQADLGNYSPPVFRTGKLLLPVIQQFRL